MALIGPVLSLLKSLEALDLSWNAKLSGEIGYLSGCTQLKRLSISGTVVSADPAGIRALLHALPDEECTRFVLMVSFFSKPNLAALLYLESSCGLFLLLFTRLSNHLLARWCPRPAKLICGTALRHFRNGIDQGIALGRMLLVRM